MLDCGTLLKLTPSAVSHIQAHLAADAKKKGFRLSLTKRGCTGYAYVPELVAGPEQDDLCFEQEGAFPVFVDPDCALAIKGTVVDFIEAGLGQYKLHFQNPNAVNECGCGESFHVNEVKT